MQLMIEFLDLDCHDRAHVIVRRIGPGVGLALSLEKNGDLEVFAPPEQARAIAEALLQAAGSE